MNLRLSLLAALSLSAQPACSELEPEGPTEAPPRSGVRGEVAPFFDPNPPVWPTEADAPSEAAAGDAPQDTPPPLPAPQSFPEEDDACEAEPSECEDEGDEDPAGGEPADACWVELERCVEQDGDGCFAAAEACLVAAECDPAEPDEHAVCSTWIRCEMAAERCFHGDGSDAECLSQTATCLADGGLPGPAMCLQTFADCLGAGQDEAACEANFEACEGAL